MKCYVKSVFCNFENFQKHIDAVFLRIEIKLSFTTKRFGVEKNNNEDVLLQRTFQNLGAFLLQL